MMFLFQKKKSQKDAVDHMKRTKFQKWYEVRVKCIEIFITMYKYFDICVHLGYIKDGYEGGRTLFCKNIIMYPDCVLRRPVLVSLDKNAQYIPSRARWIVTIVDKFIRTDDQTKIEFIRLRVLPMTPSV